MGNRLSGQAQNRVYQVSILLCEKKVKEMAKIMDIYIYNYLWTNKKTPEYGFTEEQRKWLGTLARKHEDLRT